jgi:hypothetical protein
MITHFQVTFPQEPGASFPIAASNGRTLPVRARSDVRPTNFPTRILTREEWDDLRRPAGPYLASYQPKRPVPDVDFEAEDGSLHKTAEACLAHELKARFGVETLAEVEGLMKVLSDKNKLTVDDVQAAIQEATETKDSAASFTADAAAITADPEPSAPTYDEARRLLASALSQRGLKPAEAARATGLTSKQCREVVAAYPAEFREHAGKLFLNS